MRKLDFEKLAQDHAPDLVAECLPYLSTTDILQALDKALNAEEKAAISDHLAATACQAKELPNGTWEILAEVQITRRRYYHALIDGNETLRLNAPGLGPILDYLIDHGETRAILRTKGKSYALKITPGE